MCIAIYKPQGTYLPRKKVLRTCWENNSDGAGIMYWRPGDYSVTIDKGYMTFKEFWKGLIGLNIGTNDVAILHFRFATAGAVNEANCHPFPVSSDTDKLRSLTIETDIGVAHNGIINCNDEDDNLSDTMIYIKNTLAQSTIRPNIYDDKAIQNLISLSIGSSKLIFLYGDGKTIRFGAWTKDKGLYYSNDGYKRQRYNTMRFDAVNYYSWNTKENQKYIDKFRDEDGYLDAEYLDFDAICPLCGGPALSLGVGMYKCQECNNYFDPSYCDA